MARLEDLTPGASVEGVVPSAPITVVTANWHGTSVVEVTYKEASGRVDHVLLYRDDEVRLRIASSRRPWAFDADGATFWLVSEAYRINLAALFDPLLAVHTSLVEPLPHQILAVYDRMLPRQPLRFLLADDPGAGKTIMAGLFIKELIARGDLERCLIVCPGSLAEQWQDELDGKFQLPFDIATNDKLEAARTGNWFAENSLTIARLDKLSRDTDVQAKLGAMMWDLVVVDDDPETEEDEVATQATAARTMEELRIEIEILTRLEASALALRRSGVDKKWEELSRLLQDTPEMFQASGHRRKLVIFTEHRDTLLYLQDRIGTLIGRPEAIVTIMGGMGREKRRAAEESFQQDKEVEILLATDAAGEGINLQRAHLMVNYDLPWNPNRLEQRFGRIHRIGQTEVCHVWNLIAHETREGEVYRLLLDKLEAQRGALGDRVYNVLGRPLFEGTSLRSLLIEAIRYGEQPEVRERLFRKIDNATDQAHVRELLDRDALARDSMDTRRVQAIREDMERAEAKRLQPHYIQAFFMEAFRRLGGQISERETGRFEITRVPAAVRNRDRLIGRGAPVLPRYERVTFEKTLINVTGRPTAAFICPGDPLLDAVIDLLLEQHRPTLRQGTILIDPHDPGETPRALFYLEHAIRDAVRVGPATAGGEPRTISRELQFIEIDAAGQSRAAGSAPYLDYRPADAAEVELLRPELDRAWISDQLEHTALRFAAEHLVPAHLQAVRKQREEMIEKSRAAVMQRLTREITYWDHRAQELLARERAGKTPKLNSTMARQRADDLEARLKRRMELLDRERQISPLPPVAIGGAIIVPQGLLARLKGETTPESAISVEDRNRIDRLAVAAVMAAERALGREPREMDHSNPGYDIESRDPREPGRLRFIEVKGKAAGQTTVTVSATQIRTALNKPDDWMLAIVQVDRDKAAEPRYIRCPFTQPPDFAEVSKTLNLAALLKLAIVPD